MKIIGEGCKYYDKIDILGDTRLVNKNTGYIIMRVQELIHKCIQCDKFKAKVGCDKSVELVNLLETNKNN